MIEKCRLDKGGLYGSLLKDLSKAFECPSHNLLIAKLHAYGFDILVLRLLHNYLANRKQLGRYIIWCPARFSFRTALI